LLSSYPAVASPEYEEFDAMTPVALSTALATWGGSVYPASVVDTGPALVALARCAGRKVLVQAAAAGDLPAGFTGETRANAGHTVRLCPLTHANAAALRQLLPWTAPVSLRRQRTTIGCGDRLGRATPGHVRAVRQFAAAPVLAQQSIRELTLTGRTYENVVDDVTFLVLQEGYRKGYGADGDHLKTLKDIGVAVDAGMAMITLDLTGKMNAAAENWSPAEVQAAFAALPAAVRRRVTDTYADRSFALAGAAVTINDLEARRCAVMYLAAMDFARDAYELLRQRRGDAFDLEISIDETRAPTLPAHHLFIIRELLYRDITVSSLAPRFIGEFQKGIDYIGDLAEFERQFALHCAIARAHGDYKISIHSGSDKFAVYRIIGRYTQHRVHVKTAGTSWLEAVRAIATAHPALYRRMHARAFDVLPDALKLYHITPDLGSIPALETLGDAELPALLEHNAARQVLHVTYGGLLADPAIGPAIAAALDADEEVYYRFIERHFVRHLRTLGLEAAG
jgi:tagaturonate epimerase